MIDGFVLFNLLIYGPLFLIGLYFFIRAFRRKKKIEMVIFGICMLICGYTIFIRTWVIYKSDNLTKKFALGDSTTLEGKVVFFRNDPSYGSDHFAIDRVSEINGIKEGFVEFIAYSPNEFPEIKKYLDLQQQLADSMTYKIKINVVRDSAFWQLKNIVNADTVHIKPIVID